MLPDGAMHQLRFCCCRPQLFHDGEVFGAFVNLYPIAHFLCRDRPLSRWAAEGLMEMTFQGVRSQQDTARKPDNICSRDLDELDTRILCVLQDHADLSNVELANRVGLTPPPCLRRVRRLERSGHIRGYHAKLDAKMLGFDVVGFVFVALHSQAHIDFIAFEKQVIHWPTVRECYAVHGETDFVLKCVARNLTHFQRFITETLSKLPNIKSVKSAPAVRASKESPGVPLFEYANLGEPTQ